MFKEIFPKKIFWRPSCAGFATFFSPPFCPPLGKSCHPLMVGENVLGGGKKHRTLRLFIFNFRSPWRKSCAHACSCHQCFGTVSAISNVDFNKIPAIYPIVGLWRFSFIHNFIAAAIVSLRRFQNDLILPSYFFYNFTIL